MNEHLALDQAVLEAAQSSCQKSKRGVVIWSNPWRGFIVQAHNGPPPGFACDGSDACRSACGKLCQHAEMRALFLARLGTDLLHVKVVDGKAVPSGPPSCWQCSRAILDQGIQRVWLLHEDGLWSYSAEDFHVQTLQNCGLPVIRSASTGETEASGG